VDKSSTTKPTIEHIADRITDAVMEHRLPPGSKLVEDKLSTAFKVSRTKVRQALTLLANKGIVTFHANRGAFVASQTPDEARELFATRHLVEPEIIRNVIARATEDNIKLLRDHLARESNARETGDRRAIIRLSGEFHMLLADLSGNRFIKKIMSELCPLTCLIIALYDAPKTLACPEDEHSSIVDAIEAKNEVMAVELMAHHLRHIQKALEIDVNDDQDIRWESLYG
jgi:DNA-binding GntR family transcriptional regulator